MGCWSVVSSSPRRGRSRRRFCPTTPSLWGVLCVFVCHTDGASASPKSRPNPSVLLSDMRAPGNNYLVGSIGCSCSSSSCCSSSSSSSSSSFLYMLINFVSFADVAGKFLSSPVIDACVYLETIAVADKDEATAFYQRLPNVYSLDNISLNNNRVLYWRIYLLNVRS